MMPHVGKRREGQVGTPFFLQDFKDLLLLAAGFV
jgi:hypothetical protein